MQHALSVARPKVVLSESARLARALQAAPAGVLHMVLNGEAPEGPDGPGGVDSFLSLLRRGEAVDPPPDVDTYRAVDVGDRSQSTPFVLFSSGTTGLPKGVRLRDSALALLVDNLRYPFLRLARRPLLAHDCLTPALPLPLFPFAATSTPTTAATACSSSRPPCAGSPASGSA